MTERNEYDILNVLTDSQQKGGEDIMVNEQLLKAKIVEMGFTQSEIASKLGLSLTSLNYKMNGKTEFKANEIYALSDILKIKDKDAYFFCAKC